MPDGTRKRRNSPIAAKRHWYAAHRAKRFARRFWTTLPDDSPTDEQMGLSDVFGAAKRDMAVVTAFSEARVGTYWDDFVGSYRESLTIA